MCKWTLYGDMYTRHIMVFNELIIITIIRYTTPFHWKHILLSSRLFSPSPPARIWIHLFIGIRRIMFFSNSPCIMYKHDIVWKWITYEYVDVYLMNIILHVKHQQWRQHKNIQHFSVFRLFSIFLHFFFFISFSYIFHFHLIFAYVWIYICERPISHATIQSIQSIHPAMRHPFTYISFELKIIFYRRIN